ncbi:DUF2264 domain-containing protein [Rhizobium sp. CSW-27]|uniref:DUF2264 domain-containing protein n=1 Tax=Rhizobium sp. CSW-27 TaxID=2839985 RepID=UPI001C01EF19|nr:DUF2264 domain-containing protein [Rhizobium sp. CSW-27]MBT9371137.1 DUF2264 domain-containing protein [Rhizobium sp. CSW-27]
MFGLPIFSREDLLNALRALLHPLAAFQSPGGARLQLSAGAAIFDRAAAELEGFARPLWGAVPAALGGSDVLDWARVREGLSNGCDPEHEEFWGWPGSEDQRLVEMAAIGFALLAVPERIWNPLPERSKALVSSYLRRCAAQIFSPNNWMFFRLLIVAGLARVEPDNPVDDAGRYVQEIEALYLGEGWYRDGPGRRVDHYNGFAFHTYALLLTCFAPEKPAIDHLARARLFAPNFAAWFDPEGRGLAYGRSMTYRFAMTAFFGAYALAEDGDPALPWGCLKGIILRNIRWWSRQPIADRDGVLSVGYVYPNPMMAEDYNSACSPYWALKAFLPLALPRDHPFWTSEEAPLPQDLPLMQQAPGFLLQRSATHTVALSAGQEGPQFRHGAEKYAKFAYSTQSPLSVEMREASLLTAALDGALGVQAEGRPWVTRHGCASMQTSNAALISIWHPYPDVEIETLLCPHGNGHIRRHRILTPVPLVTVEGGFAVERTDGQAEVCEIGRDSSWVLGGHASCIVDLNSLRLPRIHAPASGINLAYPRIWVPQLLGNIPAGETELLCWCTCDERPADRCNSQSSEHRASLLEVLRQAVESVRTSQ